ncbi:hypothetical protein FRB94_009994 [Tulasnella sp. JGI-2019a]|nr:hypothetical protein FRB93_011083 [Tulasnella sp. JGI-2019a]KAG9010718.1 hypothetical protein FRB94_009994 [Tulasnella sp. JGI-2019a]KAG9028604.1 hypothetical protein FRB95_006282 [Tulasnella sp. JGI-2019a]
MAEDRYRIISASTCPGHCFPKSMKGRIQWSKVAKVVCSMHPSTDCVKGEEVVRGICLVRRIAAIAVSAAFKPAPATRWLYLMSICPSIKLLGPQLVQTSTKLGSTVN